MTPSTLPLRQRALPAVQERRPCDELGELAAPYRWKCPTLGDFMRQVEHEFGYTVDSSILDSAVPVFDERLSPSAVRALCERIGVPPEDFGV